MSEPKPTFLPLMRRPSRPVEKEAAEKEMRDLLERTRLMMMEMTGIPKEEQDG